MPEHNLPRNGEKPLVYIVGLSAKPNCEHLAPDTRTGHTVEQMINRLPCLEFVKTNLVRIPPIDQAGKLRYPNQIEMKSGWEELRDEMNQISPNLLVTLGLQVSSFLREQMGIRPAKPHLPTDFSYRTYLSQSTFYLLSVHHPSYVFVYRRKHLQKYIENVVLSISSLLFESDDEHLMRRSSRPH